MVADNRARIFCLHFPFSNHLTRREIFGGIKLSSEMDFNVALGDAPRIGPTTKILREGFTKEQLLHRNVEILKEMHGNERSDFPNTQKILRA